MLRLAASLAHEGGVALRLDARVDVGEPASPLAGDARWTRARGGGPRVQGGVGLLRLVRGEVSLAPLGSVRLHGELHPDL
eukprot:15431253-Alexandrium_andersonii.AAC.1